MEIRSQPTVEGSTPPTDDNICDKVLGRRSNYITRLGYAVAASNSSRASHVSCDAHLCEVERRHKEEMCRAEEERCSSQKDIAALQRDNVELRSQLVAFEMKLDELGHPCLPHYLSTSLPMPMMILH